MEAGTVILKESWSVRQKIYRAGQIKRGQLTFLLVTSERIYKIKWFWQVKTTYKCQFYLKGVLRSKKWISQNYIRRVVYVYRSYFR